MQINQLVQMRWRIEPQLGGPRLQMRQRRFVLRMDGRLEFIGWGRWEYIPISDWREEPASCQRLSEIESSSCGNTGGKSSEVSTTCPNSDYAGGLSQQDRCP